MGAPQRAASLQKGEKRADRRRTGFAKWLDFSLERAGTGEERLLQEKRGDETCLSFGLCPRVGLLGKKTRGSLPSEPCPGRRVCKSLGKERPARKLPRDHPRRCQRRLFLAGREPGVLLWRRCVCADFPQKAGHAAHWWCFARSWVAQRYLEKSETVDCLHPTSPPLTR